MQSRDFLKGPAWWQGFCFLLFPSLTTILLGTMMDMNPGTALSPVYLEIFSSAGRILVVLLAVLAQIYLFARIRHAVRSSRRSRRLKSRAVGATGAAIVLLSALGGFILARPIPWVDPPAFVQILFFYLPAVWIVGSFCSVLILLFFRGAGHVGRKTARIRHELTGQPADFRRGCRPPPFSAGRGRRTCRGAVCPFRLRCCLCRQDLGGKGARAALRPVPAGGPAHRHPCGPIHDTA